LSAAQRDRGIRPLPRADSDDEFSELSETPVAHETDELPIDQIFHVCKAMDRRGVILLGEPGAGKTTGARQVAWQLASGHRTPAELGLPDGILPVFLRLRNLNPAVISTAASPVTALKEFLRQEVHGPGEAADRQDPCDALWENPGGLLWIIDGLDEVVDPQLRAVVSGWIRDTPPQRLHDYF
ncbi:MAG: NACHT domain-containing protein, partial [Planctomycetaceae bacterium]